MPPITYDVAPSTAGAVEVPSGVPLSFAIRLVLLVVMGVTGLVIALAEADVPEDFWVRNDDWVDRARISLVAVALIEPIRAAVVGRLRDRRRKRAALVEDVLHFMLARIDSETTDSLKWPDIGIHVWEVRGRWKPRSMQHLHKVASVRIAKDDRGGSMITWKRGMGAIGQSWESGHGGAYDATNLVPSNIEEWRQRAPDDRMGLTWEQAQRTRGYGGIVVMPMYDSKDRFRGCISVDGPPGTYKTLKNGRVLELARNGANTCAESLYDPT